MSDHLVVAGNGTVGQRVTVLSEQSRGAYDRVNLRRPRRPEVSR
jgi:hypothetical protein